MLDVVYKDLRRWVGFDGWSFDGWGGDFRFGFFGLGLVAEIGFVVGEGFEEVVENIFMVEPIPLQLLWIQFQQNQNSTTPLPTTSNSYPS